jgi:hypothetical protein
MIVKVAAVVLLTALCMVSVHLLAVLLLAVVALAALLIVHLLIVAVVTVGTVLLALAWAISQAATETGWRVVPCVLNGATA